jgi:hypothetical protein
MDATPNAARSLPRSARILIALVVTAGAGCLAARLPEALGWGPDDLLALAALAAGTLLAEQFPIELPHRSETERFSLTDAVWVAGLVLAKPGVLSFAAAVGVASGQALRRIAPVKVAFNVGQFVVALTLAEAVAGATHRARVLDPVALAAVTVGMACFLVVNAGLLAQVIAFAEGVSFLHVLLSPAFLNVAHWAGNLAVGLLGAWLWQSHRWAEPVSVLPLVLLYLAYRAWMREFLRSRRTTRLPVPEVG